MTETALARPWLRFYGDVPHTIDYPEIGLYVCRHRPRGACRFG